MVWKILHDAGVDPRTPRRPEDLAALSGEGLRTVALDVTPNASAAAAARQVPAMTARCSGAIVNLSNVAVVRRL